MNGEIVNPETLLSNLNKVGSMAAQGATAQERLRSKADLKTLELKLESLVRDLESVLPCVPPHTRERLEAKLKKYKGDGKGVPIP